MSATALSPLTRRLLDEPLLATLLRLAWPNMLVMVLQSSVGMIEAYFVGQLGTDALAGVTLVFPMTMLMTMMSAGAVGGGISSSIARTLGARNPDGATRLAWHALAISLAIGAAFTVLVVACGRPLYALVGGRGAALDAAVTYSAWVFAGMTLVWMFNGVASILRGTGNMLVPSIVICIGTLLLVPLPPAPIFSWGPLPRMGVAGGGAAVSLYYAGATLALLAYFVAGRAGLRLRPARLRWAHARDILRVGGMGALNTVRTNGTIAILTGLFAAYGPAALAEYGVGSRLEYLLVPLGFGLGAPLVAIVGTNIGAGNMDRAYRAAWIGAAIGFTISETIGLLAAFHPAAWIGLFDRDPAVIAAGSVYLRTVGPVYGLFGAAIVLNLASQGAQRLIWPFLAGTARLAVAGGGGVLAIATFGAALPAVAVCIALGLAAMGAVNIAAVLVRSWPPARSRT